MARLAPRPISKPRAARKVLVQLCEHYRQHQGEYIPYIYVYLRKYILFWPRDYVHPYIYIPRKQTPALHVLRKHSLGLLLARAFKPSAVCLAVAADPWAGCHGGWHSGCKGGHEPTDGERSVGTTDARSAARTHDGPRARHAGCKSGGVGAGAGSDGRTGGTRFALSGRGRGRRRGGGWDAGLTHGIGKALALSVAWAISPNPRSNT